MAQKVKTLLLCWLPLGIYCLAIFIQSSLPAPELDLEFRFSDKFAHFLAYAVLGILFFRALQTTGLKEHPLRLMILSALLSTLYGISDEVHQHFVPSRCADTADALADLFGSMAGVWTYQRLL
jgi:VanZ family protein